MGCHCSDWRECGVCDCHKRDNPDEYGKCEDCGDEIWLDTDENHKHDDGTWYCDSCVAKCDVCGKVLHQDEIKLDQGEMTDATPYCQDCINDALEQND